MKQVLVTGGYGYLGGRLVSLLAADPALSVTALSRSSRRAPAGVKAAQVDWSDDTALARLCRGQDTIVHLAAMNESDAEKDPEGALRTNGLASLKLLEAAVVSGVRRFVYASTSKVFGNNPSGVIDETSLPLPTSHYAITHRLAEDYVLARHAKKQIEGVVLRLANAVGPPASAETDAWMMLGNDLCRQAVTSGRIVLKSTGMAWRNFVTISDVIGALRHLASMPTNSLGNGLFHLGSAQSIRIFDLASRIAARAQALSGRKIALERLTPAPNETHPTLDWRSDKLASTGWKPVGDLDREIDATLALCAEKFGWFAPLPAAQS